MSRRPTRRTRIGLAVVTLLTAVLGIGAATPVSGQAPALPAPKDFVSYLDLECFQTNASPPPVPASLVLSHLNPVLEHLPRFQVTLGGRTQLCAPVAKNDRIPPPGVLEFVRFVDLSCYRTTGPAANTPLVLSHLNPLLTGLPRKETRMLTPEQVCLPVIKNDVVPPAEVLRLVRYIDLACYRTDPPAPLDIGLKLTQLNPVLGHIPPAGVGVRENRRLCVPVRKNNQEIPAEVLDIVRWIDLEKYDIAAPALPFPVNLKLRHINPLLGNTPVEEAVLTGRQQLALPVAKNGAFPPG
jgi:hypothetical protein